MISQTAYETVMKHEDILNSAVLYDRDFSYVRAVDIQSPWILLTRPCLH